jgi:serine/threonine protein kinase
MLSVLEVLQSSGLSHRDIKPENIIYNKGTYLLCDFDDMIEVSDRERPQVEPHHGIIQFPLISKEHQEPQGQVLRPLQVGRLRLGG